MDISVKSSIDARMNAILSAYNIEDSNIKQKIDELFGKINNLGEVCKDCSEFETKFASSPLNQEYIDLFTEVATSCKPNNSNIQETDSSYSKGYYKRQIANELEYQLDNVTLSARSKARQEVYDKARDIPVVDKILEAKQYLDFFGKFKKKDKKDKQLKE